MVCPKLKEIKFKSHLNYLNFLPKNNGIGQGIGKGLPPIKKINVELGALGRGIPKCNKSLLMEKGFCLL